MHITQYAYFALTGTIIPPCDLTARLLVEPDVVTEMGSFGTRKRAATFHHWAVECREPGLDVGQLVGRLLVRIEPAATRIRALVDAGDVAARLQVVRHFDAKDGEPESHEIVVLPDGSELAALSGQHQLLGWHLDRRVIEFLWESGAELDADEYG